MIDVPDSVKVWKIGKDSAPVRSWNHYTNNQGYNLFCSTNGKYLTWEKRPLGINLGFITDSKVGKTHFRLPDGTERNILSGELVALGIGGGDPFLYYTQRDVGINLSWSKNPRHEWRIFGVSNIPGTPISENSPVAIVNENVKPSPDFLVYFERPPVRGHDYFSIPCCSAVRRGTGEAQISIAHSHHTANPLCLGVLLRHPAGRITHPSHTVLIRPG